MRGLLLTFNIEVYISRREVASRPGSVGSFKTRPGKESMNTSPLRGGASHTLRTHSIHAPTSHIAHDIKRWLRLIFPIFVHLFDLFRAERVLWIMFVLRMRWVVIVVVFGTWEKIGPSIYPFSLGGATSDTQNQTHTHAHTRASRVPAMCSISRLR